jgi:hypothetical protein
MTKDEIANLAKDILRNVQNGGTGAGMASIIATLITNAQTISRANNRTVNSAPTMLETTSLVSGRTKDPVVSLKWGEHEGQLSPGEARDFAERIRRTADAAESDAFVFDYLTNHIEVDADKAGYVLHLFREYREERARKDYLPPSAPDNAV